MRRSRYPTRSSVNRGQNSGVASNGSSSSSISAIGTPERRSERTRSQTSGGSLATSHPQAPSHDYSRVQGHGGHHPPAPPHAHQQQSHSASSSTITHTSHAAYPNMYRSQAQAHQMLGTVHPPTNASITSHTMPHSSLYRQNGLFQYSMPRQNDMLRLSTNVEVKFMKLNSYDDAKVLIKPRSLALTNLPGNSFEVNDVAGYLGSDSYRVFLRFCKYSSSGGSEQQDCLPKSFNLMINTAAFQVKNKYTFAPYDITTRIACEKSNIVTVRISIDPNSAEANEEFHFGLYLVKKVDHRKLFNDFKQKRHLDRKYSVEIANKKLNPNDDSDEIAIVETISQLKISLLCPLSATRIQYPARSRHCDHVHCFDAESFISLNEITPRWKCPICKVYIKLDDLVMDGLFNEIIKNAPPSSSEFELFGDGRYEYIFDPKYKPSRPVAAASNNQSPVASTSNCQKRKFEEDSKETVKSQTPQSQPAKVPKTGNIECITLDSSSEDESSDSDTITSQHSYGSNNDNEDEANNDESSDDDIEIVFEKVLPRSNSATSSGTGTSSKSSSAQGKSSSSASSQLNFKKAIPPPAAASSAPSSSQYTNNTISSSAVASSSAYSFAPNGFTPESHRSNAYSAQTPSSHPVYNGLNGVNPTHSPSPSSANILQPNYSMYSGYSTNTSASNSIPTFMNGRSNSTSIGGNFAASMSRGITFSSTSSASASYSSMSNTVNRPAPPPLVPQYPPPPSNYSNGYLGATSMSSNPMLNSNGAPSMDLTRSQMMMANSTEGLSMWIDDQGTNFPVFEDAPEAGDTYHAT